MNIAILVGNLGADPELSFAQNGNAKLRLRLATSERWKDRKTGEQQEKTEWHTVIVWGKRAEALNGILSKGDRIGVRGSIGHRQWESDGQTRYATDIKAFDIELLGGGQRQQGAGQAQPRTEYGGGAEFADDDIPFAPRDSRVM